MIITNIGILIWTLIQSKVLFIEIPRDRKEFLGSDLIKISLPKKGIDTLFFNTEHVYGRGSDQGAVEMRTNFYFSKKLKLFFLLSMSTQLNALPWSAH